MKFAFLCLFFSWSVFAQMPSVSDVTSKGKDLAAKVMAACKEDKSKVKGVDVKDKDITNKIYNQYLEAFKKGVYNLIKEDVDEKTGETIPRKYFSGGVLLKGDRASLPIDGKDIRRD